MQRTLMEALIKVNLAKPTATAGHMVKYAGKRMPRDLRRRKNVANAVRDARLELRDRATAAKERAGWIGNPYDE